MTPDTVMIFAAGRGTRMMPLTATRPKPMVEVAGKPLIGHALDRAAEARLRRAVVNTHHLPDTLEAYVARERRLTVVVCREETLRETGGGLKHAAPHLGSGPVWTLNPDAIFVGPSPFAAPGMTPVEGGARLLLVPRAQTLGHAGPGDFFLEEDGRLRRRGDAAEAPFVYVGLSIIDPALAVAETAEVFSLNVVWDRLAPHGRLRGALWDGRWCDVGRPASIPLAEAMLRDG